MEFINLNMIIDIIFPQKDFLIMENNIQNIDYLYYCLTHCNIDLLINKINEMTSNIEIIQHELLIKIHNFKLIGKKKSSNEINNLITKKNIDIIIIPLTLIEKDNTCYYNFIVINTCEQIIYRYNPCMKILSKYNNLEKDIDGIILKFFMLSCKIPNLTSFNYFDLNKINSKIDQKLYILDLCYLIINILPEKLINKKIQEFDNKLIISKKLKNNTDIYYQIYGHKIYNVVVTIMYNMYNLLEDKLWKENIDIFTLHRIINPFSNLESELQINTLHKIIKSDDFIKFLDKKDNGITPLHLTCKQGLFNFSKQLINNGVNINSLTDIDRESPLHISVKFKGCKNGNHHDIFEYLIKKGANINIFDKHHITPFFLAVAKNDIDIVNLLLKENVDINTHSILGKNIIHYLCSTPLFFKLSNINWGLINTLINLGVSLVEYDIYDKTPLHLAYENLKYNDVVEIFKYCEKYNIDVYNIKNDIKQNIDRLVNSEIINQHINQLIKHKEYLLNNNTIPELYLEDSETQLKQKINNYYEEQKKLLVDFL